MLCSLLLTFISVHARICFSAAFHSNAGLVRTGRRFRESPTVRDAAAHDDPGEDSKDQDDGSRSFTALPPIGASSFWDHSQDETENPALARPNNRMRSKDSNDGIVISDRATLVSAKFKLQYKCKLCGTQNQHTVSRIAYRKGLVIAICKGCSKRHLIADNLGWCGFDHENGETNIEKFMENRHREARENDLGEDEEVHDLVKRVSREVFDLETILHKGDEEKNAASLQSAEKDSGDVGEEPRSWN